MEDLKKLRDEKMADLTATELVDINRIINGNEVTSFKKIQELMQSKKSNEQSS